MTISLAEPPPPPPPPPPGWEGILAPGERILWQGRPDGRVVWAELLHVQTLFGLFFAGFAVVWISVAAGMTRGFPGGAGGLFPYFGLIFVAIGLYMAGGRLIWDAAQRRATHYTLTDRTAYVATNLMGQRRLERWPIGPGTRLTLDEGAPGSVWFAEKVVRQAGGWRGSGAERHYVGPSTRRTRIGFRRIDGAPQVWRLMADAVTAARAASPAER